MTRTEFLADALEFFLHERRTRPRMIATDEGAAAEMKALLRIVLARAPNVAYESWWDRTVEALGEIQNTRAWPIEREMLTASAQASDRGRSSSGGTAPSEENVIGLMVGWLERNGTEMPGFGSIARTTILVARGHLTDLREARFRGFALSDEQAFEARNQRPSRAEWDHHVKVMARLRHQLPSEAEGQCLDETSASQLPDHLARYARAEPAPMPTMPARGFRRMTECPEGLEKDDGSWREAEPITAQGAATRPYTEAERARMREIRPPADSMDGYDMREMAP